MENSTIAGSVSAQVRGRLSRYAEMSDTARDVNDAVSTYEYLARIERTCRASEIDLGLDF